MDTKALLEELLALPDRIRAAESVLNEAAEAVENEKAAVEQTKARLLLSGQIDGKNAETREAQIRTHPEYQAADDALADAEAKLAEARTEYNYLVNRFKAVQTALRYLSREEVAA